MSSAKSSPRNQRVLVLLTCLACLLDCSLPGCFSGEGRANLTAEARATARTVFRKKFQDFDEIKARETRAGRNTQ